MTDDWIASELIFLLKIDSTLPKIRPQDSKLLGV